MRTQLAKAIRATSQDLVECRLLGLQVDRIIAGTFGIASALGAVAGVLVSMRVGDLSGHGLYRLGQGLHRSDPWRHGQRARRGARRLCAGDHREPGLDLSAVRVFGCYALRHPVWRAGTVARRTDGDEERGRQPPLHRPNGQGLLERVFVSVGDKIDAR